MAGIPIVVPSSREELLYFCDETSIGDEYMAVGGLTIRRSRAADLVADIHAINSAYRVTSEVKWARAKKRRMNVHRAYIDHLFNLVETNQAHLHIRFCPFREYDHKVSGPRRETDTVSKAYYQLLLHRVGRYYGGRHNVRVHPDSGTCTSYLRSIREGLNADIHFRFGGQPTTIVDVECRASHSEPFLQLLDVTLGALAAIRNSRDGDPATGDMKRNLARHALARSGLRSVTGNTAIDQRRFSIWNVRPKWQKRGRRAAPGR